MSSLRAAVAAVNELLTSLEEESVSQMALDDGSVHFTLHSEEHGEVQFTCTMVEDVTRYPRSAVLLTSNADLPWLDQLSEKLAGGAKLTKVLRLVGSKLGMDLDWVEEADCEGGSSEGGGGGSDQDEDMMDADQHSDDEENEMLREWSKCLTRWEAVERQQEAAAEAAAECNGSASNLDALSNKQIFDTKAAFRRLANEMEEIFKAQDFNLVAEANGPDGLYTWNVSLAGFTPGSQLAQDMQQVGRKFGVSTVQLQLVFKRGLHPFYPPSVRLLAPRFQGPMLGALASHPMCTTERWDPMQSAREVLLSIKGFLEAHGSVDLATERNSVTMPGDSAYLDVEHLLARLEAISAVPSIVCTEGDPLYKAHATPDKGDSPRHACKKTKKAEEEEASQQQAGEARPPSVAWAAGTGYGYGHKAGAEVWDAKRAAAVQAARDAERRDVLSQLANAVTAQLAAGGADAAEAVAALQKSCLAPLLVHQMCAASFQDMASRHSYYLALLECLDAVCNPQTADMLNWHSAPGDPSVAEAVGRVRLQAQHFVRVYGGGDSGVAAGPAAGGRASSSGGSKRATPSAQPAAPAGAASISAAGAASTSAAAPSHEEQQEVRLANYLLLVADKAAKLAAPQGEPGPSTSGSAASGPLGGGGRTRGQSAAMAAAAAPGLDADTLYRQQMSAHKVRILPGVSATHAFRDSASKESVQPKERLRRVGKELASCESDLPIHPDSSVFVVADEASTCLWKALIIGPKGTPYEGGAFVFDIYFSPDYPSGPPKVQLKTTGGGSVRFNPNLYNCGKVCLSLLGTWQGARGESWDAATSTILQVLVSIQSLIMVDQPFYNEPGYEQRTSAAQSDAYSANIMEQTLRWAILDQLRAPPPYFADVIRAQFRLRGEAIVTSCRRWAAWCREKGHPRHGGAIETMVKQLAEELRKLPAQAA